MDDELVLKVQCASGNECDVTLTVDFPHEVRLKFRWSRRPTPNDREEWQDTIFPDAALCLRDHAFEMKAVLEVFRTLETRGKIHRVGVDEEGDWVFEAASPNSPPA
jgi:hypothetical protein